MFSILARTLNSQGNEFVNSSEHFRINSTDDVPLFSMRIVHDHHENDDEEDDDNDDVYDDDPFLTV